MAVVGRTVEVRMEVDDRVCVRLPNIVGESGGHDARVSADHSVIQWALVYSSMGTGVRLHIDGSDIAMSSMDEFVHKEEGLVTRTWVESGVVARRGESKRDRASNNI